MPSFKWMQEAALKLNLQAEYLAIQLEAQRLEDEFNERVFHKQQARYKSYGYYGQQGKTQYDWFKDAGNPFTGASQLSWAVTLGVSLSATEKEVKAAYRKKVMENHPDRGGDPEEFQKIQTAYEDYKRMKGL